MIYCVIPTRGDRSELLEALVSNAAESPQRAIIIATAPDIKTPANTLRIEDFGPRNIQRWWNQGIDLAFELGATSIAVLNDDVHISRESLQEMSRLLHETDATLATPGSEFALFRNSTPQMRRLCGFAWMLNPTHGLRPDESFHWYFGDDALEIRARREFRGLVTVPVAFKHIYPGHSTVGSPDLMKQIKRDEALFRRKYPLDYAWRKAIERTQGRTGKSISATMKRVRTGIRRCRRSH